VVPIDDEGAPPWFLVLAYFPAGHVMDDDAGRWDRSAMLAEIRRGLDPSNHARATDGAAETQVVGWVNPPSYDKAAHRLSWSIAIAETKAAETGGAVSASGLQPGRQQDINFNTVILGRSGYISANLVMPLGDYPSFAATVQSIVAAIAFEPGRRYADYDAHADERADRSLGALVAANPPARKSWVAQVLAAPREIVLVLAAAAIGVAIGLTTRGRARYRRSS